MTCRELMDFLCAYLLGRLPEAQVEAFELHLAECPTCVAFLNDIGAVARLGRCARAGGELAADDGVPPALLAAVRAARSTGLVL